MSAVVVTAPKPEQRAGLDRAIEHAGVHLADRDLQLAHRVADRAGKRAALIVELALLGDVREVERIGVSLILMGGAVTDDDDVAALAQGREPFGLRLRGLAERQDGAERCQPNDIPHHGQLLQCYCQCYCLRRVDARTREC